MRYIKTYSRHLNHSKRVYENHNNTDKSMIIDIKKLFTDNDISIIHINTDVTKYDVSGLLYESGVITIEYQDIPEDLLKEIHGILTDYSSQDVLDVEKYDLDPMKKVNTLFHYDNEESVGYYNIIDISRITIMLDSDFQEILASKNDEVVKILIDKYPKHISPKIKKDFSYLFDSEELGLL